MIARSRGWDVSGSNLSIFCSTPSSNSWKASLGRSGAGRFLSSSTLTRTFTRLTLTRIRPRWAAGSCGSSVGAGGVGGTIFPGSPSGDEAGDPVDVEVVLGLEVELAVDFGFRAHGGRSVLSCPKTLPLTKRAETVRSKREWLRGGVIDIES